MPRAPNDWIEHMPRPGQTIAPNPPFARGDSAVKGLVNPGIPGAAYAMKRALGRRSLDPVKQVTVFRLRGVAGVLIQACECEMISIPATLRIASRNPACGGHDDGMVPIVKC
jgi:hypothetical protein